MRVQEQEYLAQAVSRLLIQKEASYNLADLGKIILNKYLYTIVYVTKICTLNTAQKYFR